MGKRHNRNSGSKPTLPAESRAADAITIAWTVTITTLIFCHLATLGAVGYVSAVPEAKKMVLLKEMLLFAAAVVGVLSILLLPLVYRFRRVPPPRGLVVFVLCLSLAPLLVLLLRAIG